MNELLWLLLPVAAASGWVMARRSSERQQQKQCDDFSSAYFKGLNYLLNEQQDKAIEVFIRMAEVDNETVETHLALGNLFRRRGEVDRAIRIHQNLIARPTLSVEQRANSLLELAEDYMKAGLLDRAENLFRELVRMDAFGEKALRNLLDIYEQEQDWEQAIETARQLERVYKADLDGVIAQHYCELAEQALEEGNTEQARQLLKDALKQHPGCVRASMLSARLAFQNTDYRSAIRDYKAVARQDIEYFPEVIEPLLACYERTGTMDDAIAYFREVVEHYHGISTVLALAELLRKEQGDEAALNFVVDTLRQRPSVRGLKWIIEQSLARSEGRARENLEILDGLISRLLEGKPVYKCRNCGFAGKVLHWQCPSCRQWNTVKPIHGLEGE